MSEVDCRLLLIGLDRLALYYESADPILRAEAKQVAKQDISQVARNCSTINQGDE